MRRSETKSLDRSDYSSKSHKLACVCCGCSKVKSRSKSKPEGDPCKTGPDFYTNVLGPTADETILVGLQTFMGFYQKDQNGAERSLHNMQLSKSSSNKVSLKSSQKSLKDSPNSSKELPNDSPTSLNKDEVNIGTNDYVVANIEMDDSSSQTDSRNDQGYSQTSQHSIKHGYAQTHKSTSDSSTTCPCKTDFKGHQTNDGCIEHRCLLPDVTCGDCCASNKKNEASRRKPPKKAANNSSKKKTRPSRKCVCTTKSEYKTECVKNNCPAAQKKYKQGGGCSCSSTSTGENGRSTDQMEMGDSKEAEIKYAITKITKFESYTTFEVMKSTRKKPRVMPSSIMGVFVLKNFEG